MKQIVIISGKGGTGKTVITGAFAMLMPPIFTCFCGRKLKSAMILKADLVSG
jgi:Mg-chelatase subunit ChlI